MKNFRIEKIQNTFKSILLRAFKSYTFLKVSVTLISLLSIFCIKAYLDLDMNNLYCFLFSGAIVSTLKSFFSSVLNEFYPSNILMCAKGPDSSTGSESPVSGSHQADPETSVSGGNLPENTTTGSESPADSYIPSYVGELGEDLDEYRDKLDSNDQ